MIIKVDHYNLHDNSALSYNMHDISAGKEENDRRNYFMINLHERMGPGRDQTHETITSVCLFDLNTKILTFATEKTFVIVIFIRRRNKIPLIFITSSCPLDKRR